MSELTKIPYNGDTQQLDGGYNFIMREQGEPAVSIKKSMDVHFNQLQVEIDKSKDVFNILVFSSLRIPSLDSAGRQDLFLRSGCSQSDSNGATT
jgi:hypothetical protein